MNRRLPRHRSARCAAAFSFALAAALVPPPRDHGPRACGTASPQEPEPAARSDEGLSPAAAAGPCEALANGMRCRFVEVPGAADVAIVVAVRVGSWHDPEGATGLAHVMAWWLGLTQERRPAHERFAVVARGPFTMVFGVFPRDTLRERLDDVRHVLDGSLEVTEDAVRLAVAKAKLAADDAANVLPGLVLQQRARRLLQAGTPAGRQSFGLASQLDAVDAAVVRRRYTSCFRPRHAVLAVVGGTPRAPAGEGVAEPVPGERGQALLRQLFGALARGPDAAPPAAVHDAAPPFAAESPHPHAGAPFVSAALLAPPPQAPDFAAFLIAAHVVQLRAWSEFGAFRGRELQAAFPYVDYDYRAGERVLLLNRRGRDGDDASAPRGELRYVLERLRGGGPSPQEIARATGQVIEAVTLPPYADLAELAQQPARMLTRAQGILDAELGILPATLRQDVAHTLVVDVQKALAEHFADDRITWLALLPTPADESSDRAPEATRTPGSGDGR